MLRPCSTRPEREARRNPRVGDRQCVTSKQLRLDRHGVGVMVLGGKRFGATTSGSMALPRDERVPAIAVSNAVRTAVGT